MDEERELLKYILEDLVYRIGQYFAAREWREKVKILSVGEELEESAQESLEAAVNVIRNDVEMLHEVEKKIYFKEVKSG